MGASGEEEEKGPAVRNLGWEAVTSSLFNVAIKETPPLTMAP